MSEQDNGQVPTLQRPTTNDPKAWKTYWEAQGQSWRREPEIDAERQRYLNGRINIIPNITKGTYPLKGIKLHRADIEWLLTNHDNGLGPIEWDNNSERKREGLDLRGVDLAAADLSDLPLARTHFGLTPAEWYWATEQQREMAAAHLEGAKLWGIHLRQGFARGVHMERASLRWANLHKANIRAAHLEEADLRHAHLEEANLTDAHLEGANLGGVFFDTATNLENATFGSERFGFVSLVDIHWSDVNISVLDWRRVTMLGDEQNARQNTSNEIGQVDQRLNDYQIAVRANRQLAVTLQSQGLNEIATRFAYRAQKLQRVVLRLQKKFGQFFFSGFLDLLAGYGYRPGRSVIWYLVTIFGFALAYFAIGHLSFFPDAFVFSLTSFHGRGFFPGLGSENSLHNPLVILAAFEAVIGLLIEISFIATFTQRFFGR